MRLALLTHEPFHPPSGGGSAEAGYLVRELVRRGHEVHVFAPQDTAPEAVAQEFGIQLHRFTRWTMGRYARWRNLKYLRYPGALTRQVLARARATPFDVVVSQHAISAVAAGRLKRHLRIPVVMNLLDHLTGFMETWPVWLMPPPALALLKRYELSLPRRFGAEAVLTVSDALADRVVATGYPRERVHPIYYGYDAARFPFQAAALEQRRDSPATIVMHGSFDHHHLRRIALETVAHVRAHRADARFEFIGQATDAWRHFARAAEERGLREALRHVGFVPYAEIAPRLALATIGIVPYEASSGTHCAFVAKVVEYLAVGLPVVATRLEGIRRYFESAPLVRFSEFEGKAFGEAILEWLRVPLARRNDLAEAAARHVRERLDWRILCARACEVIEAVARPGTAEVSLPRATGAE
jgi:glycosyltransferase involved in cell wall biosynthesis